MNIRIKLTLAVVGLVGVFGLTGAIFYSRVKSFDRDTHTLQALVDQHLQQNLDQLTLDAQVLAALNTVVVGLEASDGIPDTTQLAEQLETFEAQEDQFFKGTERGKCC